MRRLFYWLIPLIALLLLALFFPALVSTPFGKPFFIRILEQRFSSKISIESLRLTWFGPQHFEGIVFSNPHVNGSIEQLQSKVPFWDLSEIGDTFSFKNGSFSFPAYGGEKLEKVNLEFENHNLMAIGSTPHGGFLLLQGKVFSKEDFNVTADFQAVPTGAFDSLLKADGLLFRALGSTFNLQGTFALNRNEGKAKIALSSQNVQMTTIAELDDKEITLTEPLLVHFRITQEFSEQFLRKGNPLYGLTSKTPAILRIVPSNFRLPYRPFSFKELQIGNGFLDLGQVTVEKDPALDELFRFLKSPRLRESQKIPIWFTPFSFHMQNGAFEMGRMDALLLNSLHICTWGSIDFLHDKLDMILGIPADALAHAFGLKNLSSDYVLQIPLQGSIRDPELVTGPAAAKIAAMAAAQQLPGKAGLFGDLFQIFTQAQEDSAPPPNRPFPWEG